MPITRSSNPTPPTLTNFVPLYNGFDNARRTIDVPASGDLAGVDFAIDGGRTLAGTVLDADGNPLAGSRIFGAGWIGSWQPPAKSAGFSIDGLKPPAEGTPEAEKTLALVFLNQEKKLAGWP